MSQSLSRILVHLIYSTKNREPFLTPEVLPKLIAYQAGIFKDMDCPAIEIGGMADHVHALFVLSRKRELCDVIEDVKKGSSKWIKTQGPEFRQFYWQGGYGAFSVSSTHEDSVQKYILNQEEHHRQKPFRDELLEMLNKAGIGFDPKHLD